jgi:hypothetical protein
MKDCGFDEVSLDAVGNVVGRVPRQRPGRAAAADGQPLRHRAQRRQVRRPAGHPGADGLRAGAVARRSPAPAPSASRWWPSPKRKASATRPPSWLGCADRRLRRGLAGPGRRRRRVAARAMQAAGLPGTMDAIDALRRDPSRYLGFVEVHIEQGPVLNELDLPLGVVTSINGGVRYLGEVTGMASHAGTTPMDRRRDAAAAVAELVLATSSGARPRCPTRWAPSACCRCRPARSTSCPAAAPSAWTCAPPPTRCATRWPPTCAPSWQRICERRGLSYTLEQTMVAAAAPSAAGLAGTLGSGGAGAGPAGVAHAQRRRPRRNETARGDAAGDAVHARRQLGHQSQPAGKHHGRRHRTVRARLPAPGREPMNHAAIDAWVDAHFDEEVRFLQELVKVPTDTPPGNNAPHAERTAELLAGMGLAAEKHPVPAWALEEYGLQSITNLIVRRRYGAGGKTIALNAHGDVVPPGDGWTHPPYGAEIHRRQALRPRVGGQQERLRDLHVRAARARSAGPAAEGRGRTALHLRRGVRRRTGPRLAAEQRPEQARLPDRRRLQLPGGHRAQRLPADGSHAAGPGLARGLPAHRRRRAAGATTKLLNALYAHNER